MSKENHEENSTFKVNDQRKFNLDGSARMEITATQEAKKGTKENDPDLSVKSDPETKKQENSSFSHEDSIQDSLPAEFATLILTLASSAQSALGVAPDPMTGKVEISLNQAKHMIDLLGMLESKTKGNLTREEAHLLQAVLSDLRMRFVELKKGTGS